MVKYRWRRRKGVPRVGFVGDVIVGTALIGTRQIAIDVFVPAEACKQIPTPSRLKSNKFNLTGEQHSLYNMPRKLSMSKLGNEAI